MHSDPIADMLTRIRNGLMAGHNTISVPSSKMKLAIAQILQEEGYIQEYQVVTAEGVVQPSLRLTLKYVGQRREKRPVISGLERISSPGRRIYSRKAEIPWVLSGMGIAILSTPRGVMTGAKARKLGVGGEVLCKIW
ncbi:MAG: 30S ribosomal protein S8 [Anaerolineales bacterium]